MSEHPDRYRFRELCMDTLMRFPVMQTTGNYYHYGGNDHRNGSDCSGHLVGMRRELGYGANDQTADAMYEACKAANRPQVAMLGALHFYGAKPGVITHVTLAYDDLVAIGANNGSASTNTRAEAKARAAGWQFCDPHYRGDHQATYMPDWWPWVRVTTASLNLRDGVGTSAVILQTLPANTVVELLAGDAVQMDGYTWVRVVTSGETGYVASEWLKR